MKNLEFKIWFSKLEISNKNKLKLLNDFENIENIWNIDEKELRFCGYDNNVIIKLKESLYREQLEKEANILEKDDVKVLSIIEDEYPNRLRKIDNAPVQIYAKGNLKKLYEDNVAIIGSRNASEYGKNISRQIANDLSSDGINVVSGLAVGIDKFAHIRCFR